MKIIWYKVVITHPMTDIAILNNSNEIIDFPATSIVVLGVNWISSLTSDHHWWKIDKDFEFSLKWHALLFVKAGVVVIFKLIYSDIISIQAFETSKCLFPSKSLI